MGGAFERCTCTVQQRLLLLGPARCGGVVDGISHTTVWCLWWRVSAGRASPTRARWKRIGKRSSQTRARKDYRRDSSAVAENNFRSLDPSGARPFIAGSRSDLTWRERHAVNNRSDRSAWDRLASERLVRSGLASDQRGLPARERPGPAFLACGLPSGTIRPTQPRSEPCVAMAYLAGPGSMPLLFFSFASY
jgi:hypothetical protein